MTAILLAALCFSSAPGSSPSLTPQAVAAEAPPTGLARSVVIVTLDGVRWQEIFNGLDPTRVSPSTLAEARPLLPNLERLMTKRGAVIGRAEANSDFRVHGPSYVSLPGYTQLFTGRADVACTNNRCPRTSTPTVFDAVGSSLGPAQAIAVSSWPELERATTALPDSAWVSTGRHVGHGRGQLIEHVPGSGIERAAESDSFPGHGDYRPDQHTREIGYRLLRAQRPALLFIGLGDTDEFAHRNDYDAYISALVSTDRWLGALTDLGAKLTAQGHPVTFFITTDHGRDAGFKEHGGAPEAARTWLVATGAGITARGDVASARQLSDLAPTAAQLLGIPLPHSTGEPIRELLER